VIKKKRILIVGAGVAGKLLAKDIRVRYPDCELIGFVDGKKTRLKMVLGVIGDLCRIYNE
jgi:FlaA1/EpsC-like NDP-sugar epimerase